MTGCARRVAQQDFDHWRVPDAHMTWCGRQIGAHVRGNEDLSRSPAADAIAGRLQGRRSPARTEVDAGVWQSHPQVDRPPSQTRATGCFLARHRGGR